MASHIGRRKFLATLLGGAAAWPLGARAQQPERMRRIGFIQVVPENDPEARARITALQQGLAALDWVEGRNIRIAYRFAVGDAARIQSHVTELVNSAPDLIVANGTPVVAALKQATATIPVVFAILNDPVGQGFITSLARPGGNITGFTMIEFEMVGKWLEMLREMAPGVRRAALMFNPGLAPFTRSSCASSEPFRHLSALSWRQHRCITMPTSKPLSLRLRASRTAG